MKLKSKINGTDYEMDGNPEELGIFVKIIRQVPQIEKLTELRSNIKFEEKKELIEEKEPQTKTPTLIVIPKEETLPTMEEIIRYITTKQDYEHNTVELQEKLYGKRIKARDEPKLYNVFDGIIRRARKQIAETYNGTWDGSETRPLGGKTHVTVYRFKKSTDEQPLDTSDDLSKMKRIPINLSNFKGDEPTTE